VRARGRRKPRPLVLFSIEEIDGTGNGLFQETTRKSCIAFSAHHRMRQASQLAQLPRRQPFERRDAFEQAHVHLGSGVAREQLESHHAEVRTQFERPDVPSEQPSQTPSRRMRQANGSSCRFAHTARAISR